MHMGNILNCFLFWREFFFYKYVAVTFLLRFSFIVRVNQSKEVINPFPVSAQVGITSYWTVLGNFFRSKTFSISWVVAAFFMSCLFAKTINTGWVISSGANFKNDQSSSRASWNEFRSAASTTNIMAS